MSRNLLIVDDDYASLVALQDLLAPLEAPLFVAESGEDALRLVLKHPFAAILLDVRLPGMDGFEVAAAIRALPRSRELPIIFMSAHDDRRRRARAHSEHFLRKPLAPDLVLSKVRAVLGQPLAAAIDHAKAGHESRAY